MRSTFLPFALPSIGDEEIAEVVDSLRSGWITTGPKVKRFESDFAEYVDSKHAIAVNSCTAGLHIALTALGISPADEVIVPTLTFCSTANVAVHLGARPVLVDVGEDSNVTLEAIEAAITPRTKAIIPVHYSGQACDLDAIYALAARYNLPVVEDAAHAVGATYHGHKIGSDALVEHMRLLTLHGMSRDAWKRYTSAGSWYYEVVMPGYKANMTDIQAALGIHQLRRLDDFIRIRQRYLRLYDEAFAGLKEVETPVRRSDRSHVYYIYVIRLDLDHLAIDRAQFIEALKAHNIGTSVHFIPVHLHPFYQERFGYRRGDLAQAERVYDCIVSLPLYPRMTEADVHDVIQAVRHIVTTNQR